MTEHSEAFKEWHAKRSASLIKSADELAAEYVKDGFNDSGATRRTALLEVFGAADGSGWDAWQAGREAALLEAAALCNGEQWMMSGKKSIDYIKAFNEGCTDCEAVIRRLK